MFTSRQTPGSRASREVLVGCNLPSLKACALMRNQIFIELTAAWFMRTRARTIDVAALLNCFETTSVNLVQALHLEIAIFDTTAHNGHASGGLLIEENQLCKGTEKFPGAIIGNA